VSFVSPEAQFTPKEVETSSERDKLMFRVKIQVPPELVGQFIESIKTGVRGVGYVRYDESVPVAELSQRQPDSRPGSRNRAGCVGSSPTREVRGHRCRLRQRDAGDSAPTPAAGPVVSVKKVSHLYGKVKGLDSIDLDIPPGLMVGIVGPDGVGKSTLLALMAGSKQLQEGR
jgi:ABC-type multidrug transport system fused ATPase/permease subunit